MSLLMYIMFSQSTSKTRPNSAKEEEDAPTSNLLTFTDESVAGILPVESEKSSLTVFLWTFWTSVVLDIVSVIMFFVAVNVSDDNDLNRIDAGRYRDQYAINAFSVILVATSISLLLRITNSVFLCMGRVPGRAPLGNCDCKRPCCQSKHYAIASAALIVWSVIYFILACAIVAQVSASLSDIPEKDCQPYNGNETLMDVPCLCGYDTCASMQTCTREDGDWQCDNIVTL